MRQTHIALAMGLTLLAGSAAAEPVNVTGNVTDIFRTRFVLESPGGKYLVHMGPKGRQKFNLKVGDKIGVEGNAIDRELRARRVTLADGHAYETGRRKGAWTTWLMGSPKSPGPDFTAQTATKIATDKGYTLSAEPTSDRRHYKAIATKAGNKFDLDIHRDGRIVERPAFGVDEAAKQATAQGYAVTGNARPVGKHFRTAATKDGKAYDLDIHRDGKIVAMPPFGAADAKKLVSAKGYELIGEPLPVDEHFELLSKKDAKFFEVQAHRNGRVSAGRQVEANDVKWKSVVR